MKNKGFFSQDFLVMAFGLITSVVSISVLYKLYIWPTADEEKITAMIAVDSIDGAAVEANTSIATLLQNYEQMFCLMLMMWASIIICYKLLKVSGEQGMERLDFLKMSRGERILPDDALNYHKDVSGMVRRTPRLKFRILPEAILAALHRFYSTSSISDAASAAKDRIGMAYEQLESDLSLVRYIAWAIPSVGFIGTVRGIGAALGYADQAIAGDTSGVTENLGLAFNSTLIALLLSIVLMFFVHLLQSKQENLVIDLEEHIDKKIIGKMKKPLREETSISFT